MPTLLGSWLSDGRAWRFIFLFWSPTFYIYFGGIFFFFFLLTPRLCWVEGDGILPVTIWIYNEGRAKDKPFCLGIRIIKDSNWQLIVFIYFCRFYMTPGDHLKCYLAVRGLCLKITLTQCQITLESGTNIETKTPAVIALAANLRCQMRARLLYVSE